MLQHFLHQVDFSGLCYWIFGFCGVIHGLQNSQSFSDQYKMVISIFCVICRDFSFISISTIPQVVSFVVNVPLLEQI